MTLISSPLEIQKSLRTENRIPSIRFLFLSLVFLIFLLPVFIKGNGNQREYGGPHLGRHVLAVFEELERMFGAVRHKNKIILHEKPYRRDNAPGYQQNIFFVTASGFPGQPPQSHRKGNQAKPYECIDSIRKL